MRSMVLPVTLVALGSSVGAAQTPVPVPPGSIVRVSVNCLNETRPDGEVRTCRRERGVVVGAGPEGLTWRPDGRSLVETHPWPAVGAVEGSRGKRRQVLKGLLIGAAVGAVPGALSGAAYAKTCDCADPNTAGGAAVGALIFAVPGALLGAGIGALVRTESWDEVPASRLRVSVTPRKDGMGLGAAVRF